MTWSRLHRLLLIGTICSWYPPAAMAQAVPPAFEVATVKPAPQADPNTGTWSPPGIGRFTATHVSIVLLLQLAYGIDKSQIKSQIANKPGWLETDLWDVAAKPEEGMKLTREELRPRLQELLRQRFHLVAHKETRLTQGYALTISKGGFTLTPSKGDHFPGFRSAVSPGKMYGYNWSMPVLAQYLSSQAGFTVVDATGLQGSYDVGFSYEPNPDAESVLPALEAALKQATGLLLKSQNLPVETLVIDSIERVPMAN